MPCHPTSIIQHSSNRLSFHVYRTFLPIVFYWSLNLKTALRNRTPSYHSTPYQPIITRVSMSNQDGYFARPCPAMVSCLSKTIRFLQDTNTGRLLVIVAHMYPNALTHDEVASIPQSFAEVLRVLDHPDHCLQPETSRINLERHEIYMSFHSPLHQMMQRIMTSEADSLVEVKLMTKHTWAIKEALMDMLKTCYDAVSASLKDSS